MNKYDNAAYAVVGAIDFLMDGGNVHHRGDGTVALVMTQATFEALEDHVAQATAVEKAAS